jgi:hypothetical protein
MRKCMAFIVDKETKKFWKAYGSGLTNEITGAFDYPENSAHCLQRQKLPHKVSQW